MSFVTGAGNVVTMPGFEDAKPMAANNEFNNLISDFLNTRDDQSGQIIIDTDRQPETEVLQPVPVEEPETPAEPEPVPEEEQ